MRSIKQTFAGGEIAPEMEGRVDITRYQTSVQKALNFYTTRFGGMENRPGTKYVGPANRFLTNTDWNIKFIPFEFSTTQSYVLEFTGNDTTGIMRVIKDGSIVLTSRRSATYKWTASGSGTDEWYLELSGGGDPFASGEGANEVWENGALMAEGTAGSLSAGEWDLADNDSLGYETIYVRLTATGDPDSQAAGWVQSDYQEATGITGTQVGELTGFTQSADTVFIVHPDFAPKQLTRNADDDWAIAAVSFAPTVSTPTQATSGKVNFGAGATRVVQYGVSGIDADGLESFLLEDEDKLFETTDTVWPSGAHINIFINNASESGITWVQVGATNEYYMQEGATNPFLYVAGSITLAKPTNVYKGFTEQTEGTLGSLANGEWAWGDPDSNGYDTIVIYDSGGLLGSALTNTITFRESDSPTYWRIYKSEYGSWGWLADVETPFYQDIDLEADTSIAPKREQTLFAATDDYPRAVTLYEQRLLFGGTNNDPQTVWASAIGDFLNFSKSQPLVDADHFSARISAGGRQDGILHLSPLDKVLVFTTGSEWTYGSGSNSDALTPFTVSYNRQGYTGALADVQPLTIDNELLFVHRNGQDIRSMRFLLEDENYTGDILTYFVPHIFRNKTIKDWCYQPHPESIIWIVLDDGTFASMTYVPGQQVVAFCRQETDGEVLAMESIPNATSSDVYMATKRTINGSDKYMIELFAEREFGDNVRDGIFLDSSLSYNPENTITNVAVTATEVTVTSASHGYSNGDFVLIDDVLGITSTEANDEYPTLNDRYYKVANASTNTFELEDLGGTALTSTDFSGTYTSGGSVWKCTNSVSGLEHLEGETVSVLADGQALGTFTVSSGSITLGTQDPGFGVVHVGLGYTCDLQTLRIEEPTREGTMQGERKRFKNIVIRMQDSVGGECGIDENSLIEIKWRQNEDWLQPNSLKTEDIEHTLKGGWNTEGRVYFRQSDPLPTTILAMVVRYDVGGRS